MDKNIDYKKDLAEKLEELKKIEGFPIGTDKDILALSEPPYYTACPNPYIKDFIEEYGTPYDEETDDYHREPFDEDIFEGKNDEFYLAHTYHTKVPPSAIKKYIEHFTDKNDLVGDFFCGSGMTGVAAQLSNRNAIISDLSTIATSISLNFNRDAKIGDFLDKSLSVIETTENDLKELFETTHNGKNVEINYVVWSEVLISPFSKQEFNYYDVAYDKKNGVLLKQFICPHTSAILTKKQCKKSMIKIFDRALEKEVQQQKLEPVIINYNYNDKKYNKRPDNDDLLKIQNIEKRNIPYWYPINEIPKGDKTSEPIRVGYTHIHHLYFKRILWVLSKIYSEIWGGDSQNQLFSLLSSSINRNLFKGNRFVINKYNPKGRINGPLSGTLYIPPLIVEQNPFKFLRYKLITLKNMFKNKGGGNVLISTQSITDAKNIKENSFDYIFTDPPFGSNIMYSELNFIWESWLKVYTNNKSEAIINKTQNKYLSDYYSLMIKSFETYYKILKPKRWITVEFHNSKSEVWNKIQEGLSKAGFIIASVKILDKKKGTINQSYIHGTVKSDLVISAFKPSQNFSENFIKQAGEGLEITFINEFLSNLPKQPAIERTDKMLYSKMLAYYIQRGYEIKYDAKSFYAMLKENFVSEDGFWFTTHQIEAYLEYKKKMKLEGMDDIKSSSTLLFVNDEKSALVWLYNFLSEPKTFSDISTAFNQLANIEGDNVPELKEMLEQNFISEDGKYRRPQSETEHNSITEKRQRNLRREFETLLVQAQTDKKKIKLVRKEALVYGFELCYKDKRFADILTITKKLDKKILENSGELNDFVEAAEIMIEGIQ